jgi:predicted nuclease with TOPRIM domain
MNNEERLIEVMAELLAEVHVMREGMDEMRKDISALRGEQTKTNSELSKVNRQLGENTRAILKLADRVEVVPTLMERVIRLETEVFRKAS